MLRCSETCSDEGREVFEDVYSFKRLNWSIRCFCLGRRRVGRVDEAA
jgi:hypothetical protein